MEYSYNYNRRNPNNKKIVLKQFDDINTTNDFINKSLIYANRNKTYTYSNSTDGIILFIGKYGDDAICTIFYVNGGNLFIKSLFEDQSDFYTATILPNGRLSITLGAFTDGLFIRCMDWIYGLVVT